LTKELYEGYYKPTLNIFWCYEKYRVLLIDVVQFLNNYDGYENSKKNSLRDKEWLILPTTPVQFRSGAEYSAILDCGCISEIIKYKKN